MKRSIIVSKLMKEGFSEKTLVKFTDKQLSDLGDRVLGEENIMISAKDPKVNEKIKAAKMADKTIETYEEKSEEMCESCNCVKSECKCKKKSKKSETSETWKNVKKESIETKKWVNKLAEEKFHSFTSKNEIMELIQSKLTESEVMEPQHGSKVKKGRNGVPEFMSYDMITNDGDTKTAPTKPTTKPGTKPGTTPSKPKTPYQPGIGPKHKPKAFAEEKK